jgi:HD-like signal output (HDOD) protein
MSELRQGQLLASRTVPSRAGSAARVLMLIDDPNTGIAELANAVGCDPAFASKAVAMANSAYYGLGGRVGTLPYAIAVLGFQTVRALAVSIAAGLDGPNGVPDGFWEQAATAATAANLVAPSVGANAPDAFCAGLLHTLGAAVLHQQHPLPALCLPYAADADDFGRREQEIYGIGHAEAGAQLLASWHFPQRLYSLIATHHDVPLPDADPLTRSLHAARTLTDLVLGEDPDTYRAESTLRRLSDGKLTSAHIAPLVAQIQTKSAELLDGLLSLH